MAGFAPIAFVSTFAALLVPARASAFLGAPSEAQVQVLSVQEIKQSVYAAWGQKDHDQLRELEEELQPLFVAMPKNEQGRLEPSVVRYALHRYFTQKFGWHVQGLEAAGGSWNSSSPVNVVKGRVPSFIQGVFEEELHGRGMGLEDLAVFAAALSDLIHRESALDLEEVHASLGLSKSEKLSPASLNLLLKTYLVTYIRGIHAQGNSVADYSRMEEELKESCIAWPDAKVWLRDLRQSIDYTFRPRRNPFESEITFNNAVEVVQEVGKHFASFQHLECSSLKEMMVDMEDAGSGRVPLSKFYAGLDTDADWPFTESTRYLRSLGALDDTNPSKLSVIIPNYLGSKSNCVTPSSFYSVCCFDECEDLLAHVEATIAGPAASSARLAEVISGLQSSTVEAPRNLSSLQLSRLEDIAAFHGGKVPLHGRLFAQWLHHAYPRECRFPHAAGTTSPLSRDEWVDEAGEESTDVSDAEIALHTTAQADHVAMTPDAMAAALPWTTTEELVALHKLAPAQSPVSSILGNACMILLFAALVFAAVPVAGCKLIGGSPVAVKFDRHLV